MARNRNLRPEYFRDKVIGKLGPVVGTVYQSLWVWADDGGVARCDPQVLKAECFLWWPDMTAGVITDALVKLIGVHRVRVYAVEDDLYAEVPTLATHSPVSHPGKFRYPRGGTEVIDLRAWLSGQLTHSISVASGQPPAVVSGQQPETRGDSPADVSPVLPIAFSVSDSVKDSARAQEQKPRRGKLLGALAKVLGETDHRAREYLEREASAAGEP